jgi:hypothetical protein
MSNDGNPPESPHELTLEQGRARPPIAGVLEQYKMVVEHARFEQKRWDDNYRIFLTLAGAILAGETAVLSLGLRDDIVSDSRIFVIAGVLLVFVVAGVVVARATPTFIKMPDHSADVWYWWARDIERAYCDELVPIFSVGRRILAPPPGARVTEVPSYFGTQDPKKVVGTPRPQGSPGKLTKSAVRFCHLFCGLQMGIGILVVLWAVTGGYNRQEAPSRASTTTTLGTPTSTTAPVPRVEHGD